MPRRRRCPVCGAREWHKEAASGLVTCSEGHVLQDYRNETTERTEMGAHALRKRTMRNRTTRDGGEVYSRADAQLYHGARARYHYFECLQLLLRKQVAVLIREWGLPREFEVVCRDVWALHLSVLPRPPEPEPWIYAQGKGADEDGDATDEDKGSKAESDAASDAASNAASNAASDAASDAATDVASSTSSETDSLLADLLREASRSDSSEEETGDRAPLPSRRQRNRYEQPVGNIAVLMLACWMMRVPVMYADVIRLIETYTLPYLNGVRQLPREMRRHLARETVGMLSPHFAPRVMTLHRLTGRLGRLLRTECGIETPEGNAAPVLWRTVRALKGTSTLYGLAKRMAKTLDVPLRVDGTRVPAEVGLAGAVVVVLKLVYGLDQGPTRANDVPGNDDPASAMPRVYDYLIALRDTCVLHDADPLDVAERALLADDVENVVDVYFPLQTGQQQQRQAEQQPAAQQAEHPQGHIEPHRETLAPLPASIVPIYASIDSLGQLPAPYSSVLAVVAAFLRVDTELVAAVVERNERRLVRLANRL